MCALQLACLRRLCVCRLLCLPSTVLCVVLPWRTAAPLRKPAVVLQRSENASRRLPGGMQRRQRSGCARSRRRLRLPSKPKVQRKGRPRLPAWRARRVKISSSSRPRARHRVSPLERGEAPLRLLSHKSLCLRQKELCLLVLLHTRLRLLLDRRGRHHRRPGRHQKNMCRCSATPQILLHREQKEVVS